MLASAAVFAAPAQADTVAGWALAGPDARVVGGSVRVQTLSGTQLLKRPVLTTRRGTFGVTVDHLPKRFVVTITGGRAGTTPVRGRLRLVTDRASGQLLHVTPVTTLVAERHRRHGSLSRATREVHRYLALPASWTSDAAARRDPEAFDGERFLRNARLQGGVEAYVRKLGDRVNGRPEPMRHWPKAKRAQEAAEVDAAVEATAAVEAGSPSGMLSNLASGAAQQAGFTAMGSVLSGLGLGNSADLSAIRKELAQLEADFQLLNREVHEIQDELVALKAQLAASTYAQLDSNLGVSYIGTSDDLILADLTWIVDHGACDASAADCGAPVPTGVDPLAWCNVGIEEKSPRQAAACDALRRIQTLIYGNDFLNYTDRLVGSPSNPLGVLQAYQQSESARLVKVRRFITPSYRAQVQTVNAHYAWITALMANYAAQYNRAVRLPNELTARTLANAQTSLDKQAPILPKALPANTVIDLKTGYTWRLQENTHPACGSGSTHLAWLPLGSDQWPSPLSEGACEFHWLGTMVDTSGHGLWMPPSVAQVKDVMRLWPSDVADAQAALKQWNSDQAAGKPVGPRPADPPANLDAWLQSAWGFPDLSGLKQVRVPKPKVSGLPAANQGGEFEANPGTVHGIATSECEERIWDSGMYVRSSEGGASSIFTNAKFCKYVRLDDLTVANQCIHVVGNYYPCWMPVRKGAGDGPLDYGHWLVRLEYRLSSPNEGYYSAG